MTTHDERSFVPKAVINQHKRGEDYENVLEIYDEELKGIEWSGRHTLTGLRMRNRRMAPIVAKEGAIISRIRVMPNATRKHILRRYACRVQRLGVSCTKVHLQKGSTSGSRCLDTELVYLVHEA